MATKNKKKPKKYKYVVVNNKSYGNLLKGTKIYYAGKKPKILNKDGTVKFGKNILELLRSNFKKFHWIITQDEDSINIERKIHKIKTSIRLLNRMNDESFDRSRDIKNDIIKNQFSVTYPLYFKKDARAVYVPGTLSRLLKSSNAFRLSADDKQAFIDFLPNFIASESISSVGLLKAEAEIKTLKSLAKNLEQAIKDNHSESWWQSYIHENILVIQQGYIKAIDKINVSIGNTKFPDFSLVTQDNYLDIFEIKKSSTELMKFDESRSNYYWSIEMSKAISQIENYISNVATYKDPIRSFLKDVHKVDLQVLKPRGIVLAGNTSEFKDQKEKDDFRLLAQSLKNVSIITYDELLLRLQNYINVLDALRKTKKRR